MKPWEFLVATGLSLLCLLLAAMVIYYSSSNRAFAREINEELADKRRAAQAELNAQNQVIQQGQISRRYANNLVRDIATLAVRQNNASLHKLLNDHGLKVNVQQRGETPAAGPVKPATQ